MTRQPVVGPRIPPGIPMLMTVIGFVLVLTGITALQTVGVIDLLAVLGIVFFGPRKRIELSEPGEQSTNAVHADTSNNGGSGGNGHPHARNGTNVSDVGVPRNAETSRRRARKKREESAGAPGR